MSDEGALYVVHGSTGEYSDRSEWLVCAYQDEDEARKHAAALNKEAKLIFVMAERTDRNRPKLIGMSPVAKALDPNMKMDYTGTDYTVLAVPFRVSMPWVPEHE